MKASSGVMEMRERRKHPRYEKDLPLSLSKDGKPLLADKPAVRDLSRSGIGFQSAYALKPGETVGFRIELPGRGDVSGTAAVRWGRLNLTGLAYQYGAEFRGLGWGHSGRLRRYLEPNTFQPMQLFDTVLGLGNCVIAFLVFRELANDSNACALIASYAMMLSDWLPLALLGAGLVLGLALVFKR